MWFIQNTSASGVFPDEPEEVDLAPLAADRHVAQRPTDWVMHFGKCNCGNAMMTQVRVTTGAFWPGWPVLNLNINLYLVSPESSSSFPACTRRLWLAFSGDCSSPPCSPFPWFLPRLTLGLTDRQAKTQCLPTESCPPDGLPQRLHTALQKQLAPRFVHMCCPSL